MATVRLDKRVVEVPAKPHARKKKLSHFFLSPYAAIALLFCGIVLVCFFYLSQFNIIASQGVIINNLERERAELIIENEVWNMRMARLKSLDVIQQQNVVRRMQVIDPAEIEFINLDRTDENKKPLEES